MRTVFLFCLSLAIQFFSAQAMSEADGPDYWAVNGIATNSHLNLRAGPSIEFSIVSRIPGDFKSLVNLACYPNFTFSEWERFSDTERTLAMEVRWCKVRYKDVTGWVYARYLTEGMPLDLN